MRELEEAAGFRVGDLVEFYKRGEGTVAGVDIGFTFIIDRIRKAEKPTPFDYVFFPEGPAVGFDETEIQFVRKNPSKLNKKLYPSYEEVNGFLYPEEIAARLKEEK